MTTSYPAQSSDRRVARIAIVNSQPVIRLGLSSLLESQPQYRVSGTVETIGGALELVQRQTFDILIAGLRFDEATGLELIRKIRESRSHLPILVIAAYDERVFAERVLRAGANGYLMTTAEPDEILTAIESILGGEVYVSQQVASGLMHSLVNGNSQQSPIARLSDRELEVYELIGRGMNMREIARLFRRSTKTIEAHREHIKLKLGISTSHDLGRHAAQWMLSNGNSHFTADADSAGSSSAAQLDPRSH